MSQAPEDQPGIHALSRDLPETRYYRGAKPIDARRVALVLAIIGGLTVVLALLALITGSGALTTILLIGLALGGVGLVLLPKALASTRAMVWLTRQPTQLASLLPDLTLLRPWARPDNSAASPPDDLVALVAELSKDGVTTLGALDGFAATQQVFAADVGQKVLDQYPPSEPMMGSATRAIVEPRGAP